MRTLFKEGKGSESMSHKLYRMCLLSVVILAIVGGIFYYLNYVQEESDITEGTLVEQFREKMSAIQPWENMAERFREEILPGPRGRVYL